MARNMGMGRVAAHGRSGAVPLGDHHGRAVLDGGRDGFATADMVLRCWRIRAGDVWVCSVLKHLQVRTDPFEQ